jgi:hypothetical protein
MKLYKYHKTIINIPSFIIRVNNSTVLFKLIHEIYSIPPIEDINLVKIKICDFDDYIYRFNLSKDNDLYILKKNNEILNYNNMICNSMKFMNNLY